jgi:SET domain-containing protein
MVSWQKAHLSNGNHYTLLLSHLALSLVSMPLTKNDLIVKQSTLTGAGKGLFTRVFIPKGTRIVEYKGKIISWGEVDTDNPFIYYVKRNHVIDASTFMQAYGRYANDASGFYREKGVTNNSSYTEDGLKVFITSTKDIVSGEEILVGYGRGYWKAIRHNLKQEKIKQQILKQKQKQHPR